MVLDFSEHVDAHLNVIKNIEAGGGQDEAEDVVGALRKVLDLDWTSNLKVLFIVADAPCHGVEVFKFG